MKKSSVLSVLSAILLTWAVTVGAIFCPITAFHIPAEPVTLILFTGALTVLLSLLLALRRGWIGLCLLFAVLAALVIVRWADLVGAFYAAADSIVPVFCDAFHLGMELQTPDGILTSETADAVLLAAAVPVAFFSSWGLLRRHSAIPCAAAGLPLLIACLIILETVPAAWAFLLLTGSIALIILTQSIRTADAEAAAKLSFRLTLPVFALALLLSLISPPDSYTRGDWAEELQYSIGTAVEKLSVFRRNERTGQVEFVSPFAPSTLGSRSWDSSVERVNLSRIGPQGKTGRHVMDIWSPVSGDYHLRAVSLGDYEKNEWLALDKSLYDGIDVPQETFLQLWYSPDDVRTIQIRTDMKSSVYYLPYKPVSYPENAEPYLDAYVRNQSQLTQYSINYAPATLRLTSFVDSAYRDFVQEHYTTLPQELTDGLDALTPIVSMNVRALSPQEIAQAVKSFVQEGKYYDLNTPRVPDGEDFVLWFLENSDTGYCVHFATAAAVLLRYYGVPARYVTGYFVSAKGEQWTSVTEDDAHAWVEYFDGTDWCVLEPTPADFSTSTSDKGEADQSKPDNSEENKEIRPPENEETKNSQNQADDSKPVDAPAASTENSPHTEDTAGTTAGKSGSWGSVLGWTLGILGCAGLWFLYRVLRLSGRSSQLLHGSSNRRTIMYYRHIRYLSKFTKDEIPEELAALAEKAKFSQHKISTDELAKMQAHSEELLQKLMQTRSPWQRFLYRMIYVIY